MERRTGAQDLVTSNNAKVIVTDGKSPMIIDISSPFQNKRAFKFSNFEGFC